MLGEFLSANVSMPFLIFMVKGMTSSGMTACDSSEVFGRSRVRRVSRGIRYCLLYRHSRFACTSFHSRTRTHHSRPVAAFFLTQFLTSLLWVCTDHFQCALLWFTQTPCRLLWLIGMGVGLYCFSPCLGVPSRFQFSALAHRSARLSLFGYSKVFLRAQSGWLADVSLL